MQAFMAARGRANDNGHRLILVGASPGARRLFELTDTEFLLDDRDTWPILNRFMGGDPDRAGRESADAQPTPMPDWRDQEATNETIFREMNEWSEDASDSRGDPDASSNWYLCECSDRRCTEPIRMTHREYESIRAIPIRFAIALNHENPEIDRVLWENARFATVEKILEAGLKIARDSDPRR